MPSTELHETAAALVAEGKGILAADESTGTIKKRFDTIGVESTEENRRAYRNLLFTTPGAEEYISGVILYDETIRQKADDGTPFPELLASKGIIPGIKVDAGAKPLAHAEGETVTEGLDGLRERLEEYRGLGARFAKWRATYSIGDTLPSEYCIWTNAHALARYAALCQEAGHRPDRRARGAAGRRRTRSSAAASSPRACSHAVYTELFDQRVDVEGTLLKPNMVLSGYEAADARRRRRGRGGDAAHADEARAGRGAGHRLPLRRPVGRGRDGAPQRDERARAASMAAVLLLRSRSAGSGAEGLGRQGGERRGRRSAPTTTARR